MELDYQDNDNNDNNNVNKFDDSYMNSDYDNMKTNEIHIKDSIISTWNNGVYNEIYGGDLEGSDDSGIENDENDENEKRKEKKSKKMSNDKKMQMKSLHAVLKVQKEINKAKTDATKSAKITLGKNSNKKSFKELYNDAYAKVKCKTCSQKYKDHNLKISIETKDNKQYRNYTFGLDKCEEAVILLTTTLPREIINLQNKVINIKEDIVKLKCNHLFGYTKDDDTVDMLRPCIEECELYMNNLIKSRNSYKEIVGSSGDIPVNIMKRIRENIEKDDNTNEKEQPVRGDEKEKENEKNKFIDIIELEKKKVKFLNDLKSETNLENKIRTNIAIIDIEKEIRQKRYAYTKMRKYRKKYKAPVKHVGMLDQSNISEAMYTNKSLRSTDEVDDDAGDTDDDDNDNDNDDDEYDDDTDDDDNNGHIGRKFRNMRSLVQKDFTQKELEVSLDAPVKSRCLVSDSYTNKGIGYTMTIIVPFRAKDKYDERAEHLKKFKTSMKSFLRKVQNEFIKKGVVAEIEVVIVEQSKDKQKFNRGALLNAGYLLHPDSTVYVFHDVDLIPKDNMVDVYATVYDVSSIVHFAGGWSKYNSDKKYIGGVTLIGNQVFRDINGFPNDYQGWGGEDDEIARRLNTIDKGDFLEKVSIDGYIDLEKIKTATGKRELLNKNKEMDNLEKYELRDQHKTTWESNGISLGNADNEELFDVKKTKETSKEYYVLYETTVQINLSNILQNKFKNDTLPPSSYNNVDNCSKQILPYLTNEKDFELILKNLKIETLYNKSESPPLQKDERELSQVYESNSSYTEEDILRTFRYMFRKIRLGVFIVIADNQLQYFIPFQNIYYENDWNEKKFKYKIGGKNEFTKDIETYRTNRNVRDMETNFKKWSANDCILGTWKTDYNKMNTKSDESFEVGDQGWNEMRELISETCAKGVRNCVLFYNRRDFPVITSDRTEPYKTIYGKDKDLGSEYPKDKPFVPIIGYCNYKGYEDILVPNYADWRLVNPGRYYPSSCSGEVSTNYSTKPWDEKINEVIFRGSATGCGINAQTNKRIAVAELAQDNDVLNAKLTGLNNRDKIYGREGEEVLIGRYEGNIKNTSSEDRMSPLVQSGYKYVLHIDGHVAAYRLGRELDYNSCILKMNGYEDYKLWFSDKLVPYDEEERNEDEAVVVNVKLDGMMSQIESIMNKDEISKKIAKNAKNLYNRIMTRDNMIEYMKMKLNMISSQF